MPVKKIESGRYFEKGTKVLGKFSLMSGNKENQFRLGVYLGRHISEDCGIGTYNKELVGELAALLSKGMMSNTHVTVYADHQFLSSNFMQDAMREFGADSSITFKCLPNWMGRKCGTVFDQVLMFVWAMRDRLDIVHSTSNAGLVLLPGSIGQLVTVHDLYQAWPSSSHRDGQNCRKRGVFAQFLSIKKVVSLWYRIVFLIQFRRIDSFVVDSSTIHDEVVRRFGRPGMLIHTIPLGVSGDFLEASNASSDEVAEFLKRHQLPEGYFLMLASTNPRKNSLETFRGLVRALEGDERAKAVVNLSTPNAAEVIDDLLNGISPGLKARIRVTDNLSSREFAMLFVAAKVLVAPTLAEGFGLTVLEALCCHTPVVTGPIELAISLSSSGKGVFVVDPARAEDIARGILMAAEDPQVSYCPRTMKQAIAQTIDLYRDIRRSSVEAQNI